MYEGQEIKTSLENGCLLGLTFRRRRNNVSVHSAI